MDGRAAHFHGIVFNAKEKVSSYLVLQYSITLLLYLVSGKTGYEGTLASLSVENMALAGLVLPNSFCLAKNR